MTSYTFKRRTNDLPDGVEVSQTFEANDYLEALQKASGNGSGNVIGTLLFWGQTN
jgi:hypothetical protein